MQKLEIEIGKQKPQNHLFNISSYLLPITTETELQAMEKWEREEAQ